MASVVVNVLAAPTPTPRTNQPPAVIVPGATPEQQDDNGPTPTPIPELPELVPQIPQIDVPQQQPGPQVQPVQPQQSDPNFQPIQVNPPNIAPPPQYSPPDLPAGPGSGGIPTVDTGSGSFSAPPPDQINPVGPPRRPRRPAVSAGAPAAHVRAADRGGTPALAVRCPTASRDMAVPMLGSREIAGISGQNPQGSRDEQYFNTTSTVRKTLLTSARTQ